MKKENNFGTFITEERQKQELSMNELSKRSGVPYSTLAQIEKGICIPQIVTFEKIIGALGFELVLLNSKAFDEFMEKNKNIKEN